MLAGFITFQFAVQFAVDFISDFWIWFIAPKHSQIQEIWNQTANDRKWNYSALVRCINLHSFQFPVWSIVHYWSIVTSHYCYNNQKSINQSSISFQFSKFINSVNQPFHELKWIDFRINSFLKLKLQIDWWLMISSLFALITESMLAIQLFGLIDLISLNFNSVQLIQFQQTKHWIAASIRFIFH